MAFFASPKLLNYELAILNDPDYQAEGPKLERWVQRLQALVEVDDAVRFQLELIAEIGAREGAQRHLDELRQGPRRALTLLARRAPATIKARHQEQLARADHIERVQRAVWQAERDIVDGLAWRALDFDRTQVSVLSEGPEVARITSGAGFDAEIERLELIYRSTGNLVLHNDTTRCLRVGDLTRVYEDPDGRRVSEPIEVKASVRARPSAAQRARLEVARERLARGRILLPVAYRSFLPSLPDLVESGRSTGFARWNPTPAVTILVADFRHFGGRGNELGRLREEAEREAGFGPGGSRGANTTTLEVRLLERRGSLANLAPISIFPLPPRDVVEAPPWLHKHWGLCQS